VKNANSKVGRKPSKKDRDNIISLVRGQEKKKKSGSVNVQIRKDRFQKPQKVESIVKEEGEMSDNEEVYEQFKEVKWMEWCQDVMVEEMKTLKRLHRLQQTSANLPKEKVCLLASFLVICLFSFMGYTVYIPPCSGAFKNTQLFATSWAKDRSNCVGT